MEGLIRGKVRVMAPQRKYSQELRERAVRLVLDSDERGAARAALRLAEQHISLAASLWGHEPQHHPVRRTLGDLPASAAESKRLSAQLRHHDFRFVGPATIYPSMQTLGVVNDHLQGCHPGAVAES